MQPILGLSVLEVVLLYLVPVVAALVVWLLFSLVLYLLIRSSLEFDFKHDLLRKVEAKAALRSGRPLSYLYVAMLLMADNCIQATFLYRVSRFFAARGWRTPAQLIHAFSKLVTHTDISPWAQIGPGFYLYHGLGTVIGKGTKIGRRAIVCQGVTTGHGPVLGDDVSLWAGSKVIGRVVIGDRAEVGANGVVTRDVPPDCVAVGVPATRFLPKGGTETDDVQEIEAVRIST